MNLTELIAARAAKLGEMKALNEANPTMDETVQASYDALHAEFTKLNRDVEIAKTEAKLEADVDDVIPSATHGAVEANAEYRQAFDNYLAGANLNDAVASMTEGVDADGGYTVPETYQNTVIQKLNALGRTRSISSVLGTTSTTNIPTEGDAPTFNWIDEEGTYGQTKSTFGNVQLGAWKLGGIIKVSRELLADTAINFEAYMAGQIARGIDKAESPAFAVGDGVKKPTGYVVGAAVGASSTTAATDAVTADEIIDIFYDLKEEYRATSTWRMNDKTFKAIDKLKDGNGNYILSTLADGTNPTIKGRPVVIDNSMADLGAGNKFIVLGDFSYYQIADRGAMTIQRLNELYAGTGMVGFQVTVRVDGKATVGEAFNAGQNAAS